MRHPNSCEFSHYKIFYENPLYILVVDFISRTLFHRITQRFWLCNDFQLTNEKNFFFLFTIMGVFFWLISFTFCSVMSLFVKFVSNLTFLPAWTANRTQPVISINVHQFIIHSIIHLENKKVNWMKNISSPEVSFFQTTHTKKGGEWEKKTSSFFWWLSWFIDLYLIRYQNVRLTQNRPWMIIKQTEMKYIRNLYRPKFSPED